MFMLLAIWLLSHSFNYKGFCTCMQVMVFKEFKDKFWFLRTFKDIKIFGKGHRENDAKLLIHV